MRIPYLNVEVKSDSVKKSFEDEISKTLTQIY